MENVTTLWLTRWLQLTPIQRKQIMKDGEEYTNYQEVIINGLIDDMVEPVSLSIDYIVRLIECKIRIETFLLEDHKFDYNTVRYSNDWLPNLFKIKTLIISCLNYEFAQYAKGNTVLYHGYMLGYKFIKQRQCSLPIKEIERIKSLKHPEDDDNYCFLSVNYSLLSNFQPSFRGEYTLWYITSNYSQNFPTSSLSTGYYPLRTNSGGIIEIDIVSLFDKFHSLTKNNLGMLEIYSIPKQELSNYVYNAKPVGKPSFLLDDNSWEYIDNLQGRLFNYNNLPKMVVDPNTL